MNAKASKVCSMATKPNDAAAVDPNFGRSGGWRGVCVSSEITVNDR